MHSGAKKNVKKGYRVSKKPKEKMDSIPEVNSGKEVSPPPETPEEAMPEEQIERPPFKWENFFCKSNCINLVIMVMGAIGAVNFIRMGVNITVTGHLGVDKLTDDYREGVKKFVCGMVIAVFVSILGLGTWAVISLMMDNSKTNRSQWFSLIRFWICVNLVILAITIIGLYFPPINSDFATSGTIVIWQVVVFYLVWQHFQEPNANSQNQSTACPYHCDPKSPSTYSKAPSSTLNT